MANLNFHIVFEKSKNSKIEFTSNKTGNVNSVIITVRGDFELYKKMEILKRNFLEPLLHKIYLEENELFFAKLRSVYAQDKPDENNELPGIEEAKYKLEYFFENPRVYEYLSKISMIERQKIISKISKYNPTELLKFLQITIANANIKNPRKLSTLVEEIPKKKLLKTIHVSRSISEKDVCQQTYGGFLRALKTNTLYHITAEINGRPKALFVKTPIGELPQNNQYSNDPLLLGGYNTLAIDAENLNVYSFKTNELGKLDQSSLKLVMDYKNLESYLKEERRFLAPKVRELAKRFQKELHEFLDRRYHRNNIPGVQRIKKTHERFRVKPK